MLVCRVLTKTRTGAVFRRFPRGMTREKVGSLVVVIKRGRTRTGKVLGQVEHDFELLVSSTYIKHESYTCASK